MLLCIFKKTRNFIYVGFVHLDNHKLLRFEKHLRDPPSSLLSLFLKLINLFIYFWLRWVFVAACRLSPVVASGGYSVVVCGLLTALASLAAEHGL